MAPAHQESEDNGLTVLTVREGEASIRDFRFDCRGETSCRAELGELLQLLERRHADIAIFLAHPNLVGSLIEELRRRGSQIPEMVIAPPTDSADARVTVSVSLSGLSESAYPQELLTRLYEALRAAQGGAPMPVGARPEETHEAPSLATEARPGAEGTPTDHDAEPRDTPTSEAVPHPQADGAATARARSDDGGEQALPGIDELSARLERVLNQRLKRSQP